MYCENCGNKVKNKDNFCENCGHKLKKAKKPEIKKKTVAIIVITIALVCFFFGSLNVVSLLFSIICLASSKTSSVSVEEVSEL